MLVAEPRWTIPSHWRAMNIFLWAGTERRCARRLRSLTSTDELASTSAMSNQSCRCRWIWREARLGRAWSLLCLVTGGIEAKCWHRSWSDSPPRTVLSHLFQNRMIRTRRTTIRFDRSTWIEGEGGQGRWAFSHRLVGSASIFHLSTNRA
jgi:hypothetical protein